MSPPPMDASIDFSLILDAISKPEYAHLLKEAAVYASAQASSGSNGELIDPKETTVNVAMSRLVGVFLFNAADGRDFFDTRDGRV